MLVVGSHGHRGLSTALVGSVSRARAAGSLSRRDRSIAAGGARSFRPVGQQSTAVPLGRRLRLMVITKNSQVRRSEKHR